MSLATSRRPALVAIAALVGLIVSLLLLYIVQRTAAVETVPIVVAQRDIPAGVVIEPDMVTLAAWPDHLKTFAALSVTEDAVGRVTRTSLVAGEPLLPAKLWLAGESGSLDDRLTRGERALSVRINEMVGVDADSLLGKHVDLLVTRRESDTNPVTLPVAERLRVLAVNRSADPRRPQPVQTLTLGVSVEQARSIETARVDGTLTALLRSDRDLETAPAPLAPLAIESTAPRTATASKSSTRGIEIIRGVERSQP